MIKLNAEQRRILDRIATKNPAYNKHALNVLPELAPLPKRLTRCISLGEKTEPGCACRDRHCLKGHGIVQSTNQCQTCDDYVAVAVSPPRKITPAAPQRSGMVTITPPPPIPFTPTKDRVLIAVAGGPEGKTMFALSRPWLEAYARRLGADFVVLQDYDPAPGPGQGRGQFRKFQFYEAVKAWKESALIDVDTDADPETCPDIFALTKPGSIGIYNDLPGILRSVGGAGLMNEFCKVRDQQGIPDYRVQFYGNTGVIVVKKTPETATLLESVFAPPSEPIAVHHCSEQHVWVARMLNPAVKVTLLDELCNYQYWDQERFAAIVPLDAIIHYAGIIQCHPTADRLGIMAAGIEDRRRRQTGDTGFVPPLLFPRDAWSIDLRHARWLRETLLSGRFPCVIEVGCKYGFSTSTILDATKRGAVQRVDLVDSDPSPMLDSVIAHYALGGRVKLHRCTSEEFFANHSYAADLIFLDGDHSRSVAEVELRGVLSMKARAVFAHDTRNTLTHCDMSGPAFLRDTLSSPPHNYHGIEDAVHRPGEQTDRGMWFGALDAKDFSAGLAAYQKVVLSSQEKD